MGSGGFAVQTKRSVVPCLAVPCLVSMLAMLPACFMLVPACVRADCSALLACFVACPFTTAMRYSMPLATTESEVWCRPFRAWFSAAAHQTKGVLATKLRGPARLHTKAEIGIDPLGLGRLSCRLQTTDRRLDTNLRGLRGFLAMLCSVRREQVSERFLRAK